MVLLTLRLPMSRWPASTAEPTLRSARSANADLFPSGPLPGFANNGVTEGQRVREGNLGCLGRRGGGREGGGGPCSGRSLSQTRKKMQHDIHIVLRRVCEVIHACCSEVIHACCSVLPSAHLCAEAGNIGIGRRLAPLHGSKPSLMHHVSVRLIT